MRRSAPSAIRHGILNIDKPVGLTSHDVVGLVRRAAGERHVGHAGALDPLASGVLVVCLGAACRVVPEIQAMPKTYQATVCLGVATTTYDAEGAITHRGDVSAVRRDEVLGVLEGFRGTGWQTPPMYSALKRDGRPLYELARAGREVDRSPRRITVYELELTAWRPPHIDLQLTVSRGTYVRALAHDIGQALGVGAYLSQLTRIAIGPFRLVDAQSPDAVARAFREGRGSGLLQPLDVALTAYPAAALSPEQVQRVRHGQAVQLGSVGAERVRAYGDDGALVAILRRHPEEDEWRPERVFRPREEGNREP